MTATNNRSCAEEELRDASREQRDVAEPEVMMLESVRTREPEALRRASLADARAQELQWVVAELH
jgi:hypothetical protein